MDFCKNAKNGQSTDHNKRRQLSLCLDLPILVYLGKNLPHKDNWHCIDLVYFMNNIIRYFVKYCLIGIRPALL